MVLQEHVTRDLVQKNNNRLKKVGRWNFEIRSLLHIPIAWASTSGHVLQGVVFSSE